MKTGKISVEMLENIIIKPVNAKQQRSDVILRPSVGEDCSIIDIGSEHCVMSTDPITGAQHGIGRLAVNINVNDIAAGGGDIIGILVTVLLPPTADEMKLREVMNEVQEEAAHIGIEVLGGHTEVTDAVNRIIVSCTAVGKTNGRRICSSAYAKSGWQVVMTKWTGLEGTAILASERNLSGIVEDWVVEEAKDLKRYLSIVPEAKIARDFGAVCLHDATEGGVYGACWEIAHCSNVGIEIYEKEIPILESTKLICSALNINPYRLISSGCLIIACDDGEKLVSLLKSADINAAVIGKITDGGAKVISNGMTVELEEPDSDELWKK